MIFYKNVRPQNPLKQSINQQSRPKSLSELLILLLLLTLNLQSAPNSLNQLSSRWLELCSQLEDSPFLIEQFNFALSSGSPALLEQCLKSTIQHQQACHTLKMQLFSQSLTQRLNQTLYAQLPRLLQMRAELQSLINQSINYQLQEKLLQQQAMAWKEGLFGGFGIGLQQLLYHYNYYSPTNYLTLGFCLIAIGAHTVLEHKKRQQRQKLLQNHYIMALKLIAEKLQQLFSSHAIHLEQLEKCLQETQQLSLKLMTAPETQSHQLPCLQLQQAILTILAQHGQQLNHTLHEERFTIIVSTKLMRRLKEHKQSLSDLFTSFCNQDILRTLDPINLNTMLENREFIKLALHQALSLTDLDQANKITAPELTSMFVAIQCITETYKLFFNQRKPDYYNDVLKKLINATNP